MQGSGPAFSLSGLGTFIRYNSNVLLLRRERHIQDKPLKGLFLKLLFATCTKSLHFLLTNQQGLQTTFEGQLMEQMDLDFRQTNRSRLPLSAQLDKGTCSHYGA